MQFVDLYWVALTVQLVSKLRGSKLQRHTHIPQCLLDTSQCSTRQQVSSNVPWHRTMNDDDDAF